MGFPPSLRWRGKQLVARLTTSAGRIWGATVLMASLTAGLDTSNAFGMAPGALPDQAHMLDGSRARRRLLRRHPPAPPRRLVQGLPLPPEFPVALLFAITAATPRGYPQRAVRRRLPPKAPSARQPIRLTTRQWSAITAPAAMPRTSTSRRHLRVGASSLRHGRARRLAPMSRPSTSFLR